MNLIEWMQDGDVRASSYVSSLRQKTRNNMESIQPTVSGLGQELPKVLEALQVHNLEHPVWKIKQANGKIFLEVTWTKSKSRAVSIERPRTNHVDKTPRLAQPSSDAEPPPCVTHVVTGSSGKDKKRKKKSPSTRKRDRARLVNWRTKKRTQKISRDPSPTIQPANESVPRPSLECGKAPDVDKLVKPNEPQAEPQDTTCLHVTDVGLDLEHFVEPIVNHCFNLECLAPESGVPGSLKKCTRCSVAMYCSRTCQAKHWPIHRKGCGKDPPPDFL